VRWTTKGWETVLGCGIHKSWWERRHGNVFLWETQACNVLGSESEYARQILRLQWVARLYGEGNGKQVTSKGTVHPKFPWHSLVVMKLKRIAATSTSDSFKPLYDRSGPETRIEKLVQEPVASEVIAKDDQSGTIVVPATCCSKPAKQNRQVHFMKSFLGGRQLFLEKDFELEYTVDANLLSSETSPSKYKFSFHVCNVHRNEQLLLLTMKKDGDENGSTYEIPVPYTVGMWEETDPVEVELFPDPAGKAVFALKRQTMSHGISIKRITLVPV